MADPGVDSFTPINMFAMLRALINNGCPLLTISGAPSNGTSGSYVGLAGPGAILIDYTNGTLYYNNGTAASPTWVSVSLEDLTGDVTVSAGVSSIAPSIIKIARGSISPANIIGTSAGQLGHANGVVLVAAAPAGGINQLISCVVANDFLTAAYTGGGNVTVNISGGGAALTGLVTTTALIQSAADVIDELVPLAATKNVYTAANGLALVSSIAPTNPGTAAGVFNWMCAYRTITALLD
jgi:hypothetical protein